QVTRIGGRKNQILEVLGKTAWFSSLRNRIGDGTTLHATKYILVHVNFTPKII
ncbi:Uncharacterized protein APZ42_004113, partial [Daphnia magna]